MRNKFIKGTAALFLALSLSVSGVSVSNAKTDVETSLESYQSQNSEVYAIITIPGTKISYPIVQHATDNPVDGNWYYLRRGLNKKNNTAGCIMTAPTSAKDFSDRITVVYGHNMRNGTMFADLHKYEKANFMNSNPYVYVYTQDKMYIYKIFAAYHDNDYLIDDYYDYFRTDAQFSNYIGNALYLADKEGVLDKNTTINTANKILTLSTCSWTQPDNRFLVQAVLYSEGSID